MADANQIKVTDADRLRQSSAKGVLMVMASTKRLNAATSCLAGVWCGFSHSAEQQWRAHIKFLAAGLWLESAEQGWLRTASTIKSTG